MFSRYGYSPADDSPFANRIFDPAAVDEFFDAPDGVKQQLLDYHGNTNYSVVDIDLIDDAVPPRLPGEGARRSSGCGCLNVSRVRGAGRRPATACAPTVESLITGEAHGARRRRRRLRHRLPPAGPVPAARRARRRCATRDDRRAARDVERDYRVAHRPPSCDCGIYLQGGTEHTHGISSSLLSNTAVRAGEILDSVLARRSAMALDLVAPLADAAPAR